MTHLEKALSEASEAELWTWSVAFYLPRWGRSIRREGALYEEWRRRGFPQKMKEAYRTALDQRVEQDRRNREGV